MKYLVTGGAGFIGSHIARALLQQGADVRILDNFSSGRRENLAGLDVDLIEGDLRDASRVTEAVRGVDVIFHEAAFVSVPESMEKPQECFDVNVTGTSILFEAARRSGVKRVVIASSAAVYGDSTAMPLVEDTPLKQLSPYATSKRIDEMYAELFTNQFGLEVAALRYFNVYGPREQHKGSMASVAFHLNNQVKQGDNPKLFEGCDGFPDGGQMRDFIYVDDVCKVNLWFWQNPQHSGIFNCGTGRAEPFQNVAEAVIKHHQQGAIEYIPFPDHLKGRYQSFTQADLTRLRGVGYDGEFKTVAEGVADYMAWLNRA